MFIQSINFTCDLEIWANVQVKWAFSESLFTYFQLLVKGKFVLHGGKKTIQKHKVHPCLFSFWEKATFCFKFKAVSMDTASLLCDSEGRKHVACVRFRTCTHAYYNRFSLWLYRNILSIKLLEIHVCFSINNQLKTIQKTTENYFFRDIERF